jgi:hypothetical protein
MSRPPNIAPPIVVELGRISHADVEKLREGKGQAAEDVEELMRLLRLKSGPDRTDRVFVPIVVLYTKARQK